ncbi:MAG TPA: hypothetical protein VGX48_09465 [Pyrinomonadaceae bacterium]|jgi:hypothetical protein|nr:hypothetical protein [Pyrinomonadaceae bacterium]
MLKLLDEAGVSKKVRVLVVAALLAEKAVLVFVVACVALAALSGYRAYFQVRAVELETGGGVLRGGSVVRASVVTSGRTFVELKLEVSQGGRTETLAAREVPKNYFAAVDPRSQRASVEASLTPETMSSLRAGPAVLRATATGRPQWLRTPPPEVREAAVEIRHDGQVP